MRSQRRQTSADRAYLTARDRLRRLAANPSAIVATSALAQSLIRFCSNIVLAQLLMPAAFALVAITTLIMTGIQMVSDVGIAVMTLRHGEMTDDDESRMWTMQLLRGAGLSVVMLAIAGPVATLYGSPELAGVLRMLSVVPLVQDAQSLYPVRQLAVRNLMPSFWVEVVGRGLGTGLSIVAALLSPTVWALVCGIIGQTLLATLIGHLLAGYRPRLLLDWSFMRRQWTFSRWIQLGSTLTFVALQIDKVLFPLLFGMTRFGVYGIGTSLALVPAQVTQRWSGSIFYPLVVQQLPLGGAAVDRLRRVRTAMVTYAAITAAGIVAVSPSFFYLLYKPTYHEAGRFAQLLAPGFFFEVAESSLRHFPLAQRTSRYEFVAVAVRIAAFLGLIAIIRFAGSDADSYALAYTMANAVSYLLMLIVCARSGYVLAGRDLVPAAAVTGITLSAYFAPLLPGSAIEALLEGAAAGLVTLFLLALTYRRYGLPSLPRQPELAVAPAMQRDALDTSGL